MCLNAPNICLCLISSTLTMDPKYPRIRLHSPIPNTPPRSKTPTRLLPQKRAPVTASSLLAAFAPRQTHSSATKERRTMTASQERFEPDEAPLISPDVHSETTTHSTNVHDLRGHKIVGYAEDDTGDWTPLTSQSSDLSEYVPGILAHEAAATSQDPSDFAQQSTLAQPRHGRYLRQRPSLPSSTFQPKSQSNHRKRGPKKPLLSVTFNAFMAKTSRARIRDEIAAQTLVKQNNFLLHNKDFFLPLLPETNYIKKLEVLQENGALSGKEVLHDEIDTQPKG